MVKCSSLAPRQGGLKAAVLRTCHLQINRRLPGLPPIQCAARHSMQRIKRTENVSEPGFWVDTTCIDCDTCRWLAPHTFRHEAGASAVYAQPSSPSDRQAALQALISCPTFSIHVDDARRGELAEARDSFPLPIPGTSSCYHLGYHDEASYGAAAYFIRRPEGNVMVDAPRWAPHLAQRLGELGGVKYIFLSHRDDVGAHAKWAAHFGATRIIHSIEANSRQGTE